MCRTLYRYVDWNSWQRHRPNILMLVVPYIGTWIETGLQTATDEEGMCRTLYRYVDWNTIKKGTKPLHKVVPYIGTWIETQYLDIHKDYNAVVPYIGTWIETDAYTTALQAPQVVPYIGTWIETIWDGVTDWPLIVVPYIGTWIETEDGLLSLAAAVCRTLYRYVDWNRLGTCII